MKCDELKYERLDDAFETYPDSTLVIRKQYVDSAIAELKAENERLVKCCKEYDSRQRIDETIKFNDAKQTRKMRHALWLARAERYKMKEFIAREEGNLRDLMAWSQYLRERTYNQWVSQLLRIANLANKLQNKCRKKAEEYK